ncbi:MAG: rod shape-determining protein MreC [Bilifractor sp.]
MKKKGTHIKSRYLLVILTIICISLVLLTASELVPVTPIRNAAGTLLVPIQTGINKVGDWLNGQEIGQKNARELAKENEALKSKISDLEEENTVLTENTKELEDLRNLYSLDQDYNDYDKIAATVIAKDSGNWYNSFTVNRGSNDGVAVNMNVLCDGGLAGIVTEVGSNWAKVRSLIDDGNNVSAMLLDSSENCIVTGSLSLMDSGKLALSELSADATVSTGERVVTSNISDKYLPGILIGYVDSVENDSNLLTKTGYVIPAVDFSSINHVLIIKQLKETTDS